MTAMNYAQIAHENHFESRYVLFDPSPDGTIVLADNNPMPGYREARARFVDAALAAGFALVDTHQHGDEIVADPCAGTWETEMLEDYSVAWVFRRPGNRWESQRMLRDIQQAVFVELVSREMN